MDALFLFLVGVPLLVFAAALGATALGVRRVPQLRHLAIDTRAEWPRVSIVVPACDEEGGVEDALKSLLAQRYPSVQVVAVNDRSSDATGAIMDRLAAANDRLSVVHIESLPEGWLGKLNALHQGVKRCDGEWLLFADADAHLGERTLQKSISYADAHGIDFVSVIPHIASAGFLGDTVFNVVTGTLCLFMLPWRIRDPRRATIGATGAFMLVRASAFARTPGFEWLKLEVADDFGLCLMIKTHGGRCDLLNAREEVKIAWYSSVGEISSKMQKNFYAITGRFSPVKIVGQAAMTAWLGLFPLAALLPAPAPWRWGVLGAAVGLQLLMTWVASRWAGRPAAPSLLPSVGFVLIAFMMVRAAIAGWRMGGIRWRGVLYPTSLLRDRQRVKV